MNRKEKRKMQKDKNYRRIKKNAVDTAYRAFFDTLMQRWKSNGEINDDDVIIQQDEQLKSNN